MKRREVRKLRGEIRGLRRGCDPGKKYLGHNVGILGEKYLSHDVGILGTVQGSLQLKVPDHPRAVSDSVSSGPMFQGYLAHKKQPPPLGPP